MKPGERVYDKARDKQWSSEVYHKAKDVIEKTLSATSSAIQYDSICGATRLQYTSLCDDTMKDPGHPCAVLRVRFRRGTDKVSPGKPDLPFET
jgi:hypothetical protein